MGSRLCGREKVALGPCKEFVSREDDTPLANAGQVHLRRRALSVLMALRRAFTYYLTAALRGVGYGLRRCFDLHFERS